MPQCHLQETNLKTQQKGMPTNNARSIGATNEKRASNQVGVISSRGNDDATNRTSVTTHEAAVVASGQRNMKCAKVIDIRYKACRCEPQIAGAYCDANPPAFCSPISRASF
jgi:hypothetical protein